MALCGGLIAEKKRRPNGRLKAKGSKKQAFKKALVGPQVKPARVEPYRRLSGYSMIRRTSSISLSKEVARWVASLVYAIRLRLLLTL